MNFENIQPSVEKPELPPELIEMAKKGIEHADEVLDSFAKVAKVMAEVSTVDGQEAYERILNAITELQIQKQELHKYT